MTNDGQLAHQLLSPKKHVPKTYFAVVGGEVTEADVAAFQRGVVLDDGYETKPAKLVVLKSGLRSDVEVTITEGKFHQVKRMFQAVGKRVVYLKRIQMGPLALDPDLAVGEYRELTDEEVDMLKQYRPETDEKKEPDAVPFLWKNSGYSSVEKWFAFISHLAYPIGTGLRRDAHFFVCGRPFALAWAANEIVVHKHVQVALDRSWGGAELINKFLGRNRPFFANVHIHGFDAGQHPVC